MTLLGARIVSYIHENGVRWTNPVLAGIRRYQQTYVNSPYWVTDRRSQNMVGGNCKYL